MGKKLFIGSLPFETTEDELRALFEGVGQVTSCQIIMDKFSGRSRGFGFVEMATDEEAAKAIESLNGKEVGKRAIVVNEAKPMTERKPGGGGGFRGGRGGGYDRGGF